MAAALEGLRRQLDRLSDPALALAMTAAALAVRAAALGVALPPPDPDQGMYVALLAGGLAPSRVLRSGAA